MRPTTVYNLTALALLALLAVTMLVWAAGLGSLGVLLGLVFAALKTLLIAAVFMHLRADKPMARLFAAAGLFWLLLLMGLTLADYLTRA